MFNWENILPSYLTENLKGRLRFSLEQFKERSGGKEIQYNDFYKSNVLPYFMQADLIVEIRYPYWDGKEYSKKYTDAIILSNSCDLSNENERTVNVKQCVLAPTLDLDKFVESLQETQSQNQIDNFIKAIRLQEITNIFYLPPDPKESKERIVLFDKVFWIDVKVLTALIPTITEERIATLNHFGLYLFIVKMTYHFCRFPEENDRPE